jgi:hypothetical protein
MSINVAAKTHISFLQTLNKCLGEHAPTLKFGRTVVFLSFYLGAFFAPQKTRLCGTPHGNF